MITSLRPAEPARTFMVRMAAGGQRAQRIRDLKTAHPELTWAYIADKCGVRERSAVAWAQTGGISYGHARRLADVFGVDADWLWRGETPEPFASDGHGDLQAFEQRLAAVEDKLDRQYVILGRIMAAFSEPEILLDRISRAGRELEELGRDRPRAQSERREAPAGPDVRSVGD